MGRRNRHRRSLQDSGGGVATLPVPGLSSQTGPSSFGLTSTGAPAYDPGPPQPAASSLSTTSGDSSRMASFGESLRRERELRRITLREVSEATKINSRYLEALERNEFTYLPGGAFTKGFIRAYARYIGVDEAEMLNAYLFEIANKEKEQTALEPAGGVDTLREHFQVEYGSDDRRRRRLRLAVVLGGILLLAALIGIGSWYLLSRSTSARYTQPSLSDTAQP